MFPKRLPLRIALIAMLAFGPFLLTAGAVSAQTDDIDPYIEVEGEGTTNPDSGVVPNVVAPTTPAVQGDSVSRSSALPLTGSEIVILAIIGLALVGGGGAVLMGSKRRRAVS